MAVGVTSSIVSPYKGDDMIDAAATGKPCLHAALPVLQFRVVTAGPQRQSGLRVPRSWTFGPGRRRAPATHGWVDVQDVPVRPSAQPCHSVDVDLHAAVLKLLSSNPYL